MHLGLIDRPFVPHNLISAQESPVPLLKFQMASRLKIFTSSGSKEGTQIYFFFAVKKSQQMNPLQVPQEGLYGERYPFTGHFCLSLKTLIKIPLNKIFFFLFSKILRKEHPSMFPKIRALWKQTPISRALLNIYFGVPGKGALPPGPFRESLGERCPIPRALFH